MAWCIICISRSVSTVYFFNPFTSASKGIKNLFYYNRLNLFIHPLQITAPFILKFEIKKEEIQTIYENTKDILSLRKRQIETVAEQGGGSVECDVFRYYIDIEQSSTDPAEAKVTRKLVIRVKRSDLAENFDDIFPHQIDEIVIPYEGKFDFDDLVEKFENLEDIDGGKLYDNEMKGEIEYKTYSGLSIKVNMEELEVVITPNRTMKCMELIDTSMEGLKKISGGKINLLN